MTWTTRPRSEAENLSAIIAGEGPTFLLLHGVGLRAEAWNPVIDVLSQRFRVVAPDMPGHGHSRMTRTPSMLSEYTDAVAPLLDQPAFVAGHSMGAMIALDLAARFPERIRGVAALNAIYRREPKAQSAVRARAAALDPHATADPAQTLDRWFGPDASPERIACHQWLRDVDPTAYKAAYTVFANENGPSDNDLAALTCPAQFMTGRAEPNSTPEMSRQMAALTPHGSARVLDGAAHMMPMTHPDAVASELMTFAKGIAT